MLCHGAVAEVTLDCSKLAAARLEQTATDLVQPWYFIWPRPPQHQLDLLLLQLPVRHFMCPGQQLPH